MKHRVLALLVVLVLSVMSVGVAAAQGGSDLKAVTTGAVTIYAEPNTGAEVVAEVASFSEVTVLATDPSGAWLQVDAGGNVGYAPLESFVVLNLSPLAPKFYVATNRTGATSLFATPNVTGEFLGSLEDGTVATVLGTYEQWAYVETPQGRGWSLVSDWEALPEGARQAVVVLGRVPEMGVFAEPSVTAEVVATFPADTVLWLLGEPEGEFVPVLLPGGDTGYALAVNFSDLPAVWVDALAGRQSAPALFAEPDVASELLGTLEPGTALTFVEAVDDTWIKLYHPAYGFGYGMASRFGPKYFIGTVQVPGAVVRVGPNDNLYNAVAQLPAGAQVVVKGLSESRAWFQVAIPFEEVDYGYNGVAGWMRDFLFADTLGNQTVDTSLLSVTE